ncbi:Domain of unknown function DUF3456 [Ostreococcus tauri]|uniref:TLR4 regulator and MIR-interacting MSAP-domain-containing protein n=1 Tax=Ostreococcus tauri TaxID=70448 RepID=Q017C7_OSTTA|nr:Domain of unknown function DUF3456 [Ostreococcus tauri]OUS48483.1 TLR4 regulator and MIR-interacting MSAP-domain-containing protein [Ostreococcus tauri]CAL53484.1 Domain of unknown function DUF3456 [Ostreococcus tauri]|eukprot:XP_003079838.1 Domain of unknown function DUF3456 [Ostreococcus tauri]
MSRSAVVYALVVALVTLVDVAKAIEGKCSACRGVGKSLADALRNDEKESEGKVVDMRGRLDSRGKRYGKKISYKESELRFEELLENVCADDGKVSELQFHEETARWRKPPNPVKKIRGARAKAMKAEIMGYCHRVIESAEDALREAVYQSTIDGSTVEEFLCRNVSKECDADVDFSLEEPKENELYTDDDGNPIDKKPDAESKKPAKKKKKRAKKKETENEL